MFCDHCGKEIKQGSMGIHTPSGVKYYHLFCFIQFYHGEKHEKTDTEVPEEPPNDNA